MDRHVSVESTQFRTSPMLNVVKFPVLAPMIQKYPSTAGPLFQTYNDLSLGSCNLFSHDVRGVR